MTSDEDGTLGEVADGREPDAARPIPAGVGFGAKRTGARDGWIVFALVVAGLLALRAAIAPASSWLAGRIPFSVDESIGTRIADLQRLGSGTIDDARAAKLRALVGEVVPKVRDAAPGTPLVAAPRVTLLDTDDVNALALPGGEIFVLRGLLEKPGVTDDVLFGVLAHEVAHAAERHGVKAIVRRNLLRTVAVVLFGGLDAGTVALVGEGLSLGDLAYDRAMEDEADAIAGRALLAAGRPVEPLAHFLEELDTAPAPVSLFTNHPAGRERAAKLRAMATR